ncbi:putative N-acetyltransferase YhbS [Loktanella sp. PT4BL]|jgi:putative acetyltransferase|uniref:GNAT family N-acetyltransferase n=1 Tax=Loktanella sp. PT4BL TaxID=2135611 RepID=UPI000D75EFC4|nr:N-acetyltransferase [Loktanella sp. PT4BL]PXW67754.1 putative N-acetyltransferase YhbS [Loktanella sp. PT4BL]
MDFSTDYAGRVTAIADLFAAVFTASEGAAEGAVIGQLASEMLTPGGAEGLLVCLAIDGNELAGAVMFSPLHYRDDPTKVALLSPMAIATAHHGKGLGQSLIRYGLEQLRARNFAEVLTNGDINFYAKTGFEPVTQAQAQAPFPLQYPQGWLGRSLTDAPFTALHGPSTCAHALSKPEYW